MNHSEYIKRRDEITHHPRLDEWEELEQAIDQLCLDVIGEEKLQTIHFKTYKGNDKTGKRKKAGWKIRDVLRQAQRAIIKGDE